MAESDDKQLEGVSQTWFNRILSTLLCRGDLADEKLEARPVSVKELFRYTSAKDKVFLILGCVLAICVGILQPMTCVVSGYIANIYLKHKGDLTYDEDIRNSALIWCSVAGVCGILSVVVSYFQNYCLTSACTRTTERIRMEFIRAVLKQDAYWFEKNDSGTISAKLNDNIERIRDGIGDKVGLITRGVTLFIVTCIISFVVSWRTTVCGILLGPIGAIVMGLMARFSAKPMKKVLETASESSAVAEEVIMNIRTVASCNGQQTMLRKYTKILEHSVKYIRQLSFINGFFEGLMFFELYIFFCAALTYGTVSYFAGASDNPGTILIAANALVLGGYFLSLLGPHMMAILKARVAAAVIYSIIDREPHVSTSTSGVRLLNCKGQIEFKDVRFKYESRDTIILDGCSWKANEGETIAFVGHSGCGKSTSIGLLTRLYNKCGGTITVDDIMLEDIPLDDIRKNIGIVQQEPYLFNGSIRENIMLGRAINESKMEEAARIANAHDFIMKLSDGYNTIIGSGGIVLSGGQKQRIAIARAIATNPRILLLDEATSALDSESEKIVQLALNKASRGRTTIMIAHRLSTLKDVHRIHVIDKGKVVEIGSHQELIELGGIYSAMAKAQEIGLFERKPLPVVEPRAVVPTINPLNRSSMRSSGARSSITYVDADFLRTVTEGKEKKRKKMGLTSIPLFRLYFEIGGDKLLSFLTTVCCCIRGLELPAFAYLQIYVLDALDATKDTYAKMLVFAVISFFVEGILCWIFITLCHGLGGWASEIIVNNVRRGVVDNLLHEDAEYFDNPEHSNANCCTQLAQRAPAIAACLDYRFMLLVNNIIALLACCILVFLLCWPIGVCSMILLIIMISLLSLFTFLITKYMSLIAKKDGSGELAVEIFEHARTIQLLSVTEHFTEKFEKYQAIASPITNKLIHANSAVFSLTMSYVFVSDFFAYGIGAYMIYYGYFEMRNAFIAALCANFACWSIVFAAPSFNDMVKANAAASYLFDIISSKTTVDINEGDKPDIVGDVSVEKLSFSYPSRPNQLVARNLNLKASRGQAIALVGASGCGKSTVIQLLERFYSSYRGNIMIDNNNISDISLRHLRNNVALVGQEPILFKGSILENITLGCEDVSMEEVRKAAEISNAVKFIEAFPAGYDTDVGEKGRALSGGQKQRIAIARALVRNPRILLLDEATSALDNESEEKVQQGINDASLGRTSITIAHRLSTIQKADRIYYIENGGVVEYGTHDELMETGGRYAKLVAAQALQ